MKSREGRDGDFTQIIYTQKTIGRIVLGESAYSQSMLWGQLPEGDKTTAIVPFTFTFFEYHLSQSDVVILKMPFGNSTSFHLSFYDSFKVKKKHINTTPQAHLNAIPQHTKNAVHNVFSNSNLNILYKSNTTIVYNNDGILDFEHENKYFMTSWDADSQFSKFKYLIIFFVESASLLFKNQLFGEKKCNGRIKPGNSCKINTLISVFWGKYIRLLEKKGNFGEKEKKETVTRNKEKKETPYLTPTRNFCPPTKISFVCLKEKPYFSLFSPHNLVPIFPPLSFPIVDCFMNQVYVLKTSFEKTVIPKIRRLRGMFANAPTIQSTLRRFSLCC